MKAFAILFVCELTNLLKRINFLYFLKIVYFILVQSRYNDKILSIYEKTENMGDLYE